MTCCHGHLQLAQWLISVKPNINISAENEDVFRYACSQGYLQVAQWLLSVKPDINISAKNEDAFRWACHNGYLQVAQWLLSIKSDINISVDDEGSFRWACYFKHLQIAQWLQTLKPYLYVINYNENGTYESHYVRTKAEEQKKQRFVQRIHALWLASNTTPNKNNILYQLPQDISRLIISYI